MTFAKKPQEKTEFEQIKEEVAAAVQREQTAEAQDAQQEADCRRRYEAAKQEQNAALESGNMEQYRNAGLAAESSRLELEFCEKRRRAEKKPAASQDDDRRINRALRAEEIRIKTEAIDQVYNLLMDIVNICADANNNLIDIDKVSVSWSKTVMKDNSGTYQRTDDSKFAVNSIATKANGILNQIKIGKGV